MKELSIEEKAKHYDTAIAHAKMLLEVIGNATLGNLVLKNEFERMFPELNKDGRIRKALLESFNYTNPWDFLNNKGIAKGSIIAWLEKQGEQKPIKEHNACEFCEDRYGCVSPCPMKLIEEEKYTDNVEPKFHEGDWVISPNGVYWHIDAINNNRYDVSSTDGARADWPLNTNLYRLWTIQDAKAGDVLVNQNGEMPFIFKSRQGNHIYCYCAYTNHKDRFFPKFVNDDGTDLHWINLFHEQVFPATKEQRDLLFQKMKEAGYEWDAEKKELKKVEKKKDIHNKLTAFEFSLKHIIEEAIECGDIRNLKNDADLLLRIARKTSWNEEDEKRISSILLSIEYCKEQYPNLREYQYDIDWLKSLKERYTWKPSDEQMDALHYVTNFDYGGHKATLVSLYEQLKKLKE